MNTQKLLAKNDKNENQTSCTSRAQLGLSVITSMYKVVVTYKLLFISVILDIILQKIFVFVDLVFNYD